MNINIFFVFIMASVVLASCKKGAKMSEPENHPPEAFNLLTVKDNAIGVGLKPTFSWEPSYDQDGDQLTYTIYLDIDSIDPKTDFAVDLRVTEYTPDEKLKYYSRFYWKVVADDGHGGTVSSPVFTFITKKHRLNMVEMDEPNFRARAAATLVSFKGKLVLIGGYYVENQEINFLSDVLTCVGEREWYVATTSDFPPRSAHTSIVFKDKIWIIGGRNNMGFLGDVWYSSDGGTWLLATKNLTPRFGHKSFVYDGKMWIIGGYTQTDGYMNDVWYSSDGANWTRANANAAFPPRALHSTLVYKDRMWVFGGWDGDFVEPGTWTSTDGKTWTPTNDFLFKFKIAYHSSLVFHDKIWVIAGKNIFNSNFIFDWHWESEGNYYGHSPPDFNKRYSPASAVFNDKLWVVGGYYKEDYYNDVWYFD